MCGKSGLHLHNFLSNFKEVLSHIHVPVSDRSDSLRDIDLMHEVLPVERSLGMQQCVNLTPFYFALH